MCQTAFVDGKWLSGLGEFRRVIEPHQIVFHADYQHGERDDENDCLCQVDLVVTAEGMDRVACQIDGEDPMEVWIMRPEEVSGRTDMFRIEDAAW